MNVLVVDDDASVNKMICNILKDESHTVYSAADGMEAIRCLETIDDLQLVISDIIMPEKEGIETIREVKKISPDIKIIAISGGGKIGAENYLKLANTIGADISLKKPFSRMELLEAMAKIGLK